MHHHDRAVIIGCITDIFAHRFVIETASGTRILADLGPEGAKHFKLSTGTEVTAEGEAKPSELKVDRIALKGGAPIAIPHKPKPHKPKHSGHHHDSDAEPNAAMAAVRTAGFEPLAAPRRKPKHFEVLARSGHAFVECHVEFDGHIRKQKIIASNDPKWADDIKIAA